MLTISVFLDLFMLDNEFCFVNNDVAVLYENFLIFILNFVDEGLVLWIMIVLCFFVYDYLGNDYLEMKVVIVWLNVNLSMLLEIGL